MTVVSASVGLANVAYEQNNLERAEHLAAQALDLARRRGNEMLELEATIPLARIHTAYGDFPGAVSLLTALNGSIKTAAFQRQLQTEKARLSIRAGDTLSLTAWRKAIVDQPPYVSILQKEREAFTLVRLDIADGKPAEALKLLHSFIQEAAESTRLRSQVEALILEALALHAQANGPKASALAPKGAHIGPGQGLVQVIPG